MTLKLSQTTRGNEKKKPPFLAFHFLSSLSSTRGVKATQEERAGGRGERDAWRRSSTRLGGGEGKKNKQKGSKRELIQLITETDRSRESRTWFQRVLRWDWCLTSQQKAPLWTFSKDSTVRRVHSRKTASNRLTPGLIQGTVQRKHVGMRFDYTVSGALHWDDTRVRKRLKRWQEGEKCKTSCKLLVNTYTNMAVYF